jgi:hypothetical protein
MSFHQYSWTSEVETTWISLIGWPHRTSYGHHSNPKNDNLCSKICTIPMIWGFSFVETSLKSIKILFAGQKQCIIL